MTGKNTSFIVKVNPDGTHERVETTSRKKGKRNKNESVVARAFDRFKSSLDIDDDKTTDTTTTTTTPTTNTGLTDTSLTDGPSPGGGTSLQETPFVDRTVDRPEIVETTPSTEVVELKPDEVAPVTPSTPKTVVQQVAPVTQTQTPQATPFVMPGSVPQTGTVATPVQTAGLSAVPGQVTYKTSYAVLQVQCHKQYLLLLQDQVSRLLQDISKFSI